MKRDAARVVDTQDRVIALLNLPTFQHEEKRSRITASTKLLREPAKQSGSDGAAASSYVAAAASPSPAVPLSADHFDF